MWADKESEVGCLLKSGLPLFIHGYALIVNPFDEVKPNPS